MRAITMKKSIDSGRLTSLNTDGIKSLERIDEMNDRRRSCQSRSLEWFFEPIGWYTLVMDPRYGARNALGLPRGCHQHPLLHRPCFDRHTQVFRNSNSCTFPEQNPTFKNKNPPPRHLLPTDISKYQTVTILTIAHSSTRTHHADRNS